jgi:hypothetical protein
MKRKLRASAIGTMMKYQGAVECVALNTVMSVSRNLSNHEGAPLCGLGFVNPHIPLLEPSATITVQDRPAGAACHPAAAGIWLSSACSSLTSFMAASRSSAGAPTLNMAMERRRFSNSNWRSMGTNICSV